MDKSTKFILSFITGLLGTGLMSAVIANHTATPVPIGIFFILTSIVFLAHALAH